MTLMAMDAMHSCCLRGMLACAVFVRMLWFTSLDSTFVHSVKRVDATNVLLAHPDIDVNGRNSKGTTALMFADYAPDVLSAILSHPRTDANGSVWMDRHVLHATVCATPYMSALTCSPVSSCFVSLFAYVGRDREGATALICGICMFMCRPACH